MTDLEFLQIQAGLLRGRIARLRGVVIGVAPAGQASWIGDGLPGDLAASVGAIIASSPRLGDPSQPPPALDACQRAIEAATGMSVVRHTGPSYVFPEMTRFDSAVHIVRSDVSRGDGLANPGNWGSIEWQELLDGRLGPWAMVTARADVLSICHTPLPMTEQAAECGVWTRPDARGRGYAAATAAAWASILEPTGRRLFYHHDAENVSSQRVAQRLGLRPIGWLWRVAIGDPANPAHPLSSEAARPLDEN